MGNLRPKTPTKAALTARANVLRSSQLSQQQPVPQGSQAQHTSADADAAKSLIASSPQVNQHGDRAHISMRSQLQEHLLVSELASAMPVDIQAPYVCFS